MKPKSETKPKDVRTMDDEQTLERVAKAIVVLEARCAELEAALKLAEEALEFYAKGKNKRCFCEDENLDAEDEIRHQHQWVTEDGECARTVLVELRKKKKT